MMLSVQLNSGSKPSWSTHGAGFTCVLDVVARAGGWGTTDAGSTILNHYYSWSNVDGLASKATADASGNNIASTYATKDYVAQAIKEALAATIITYDGKVTYKG